MWPFDTKLIKQELPSVQSQVRMAIKSVTIPQAAPAWKLFAKKDAKWDIQTAIDEGYNASAAVYTCVEKRAKLMSAVPWVAKRKLRDGTLEDAPDSPLQALIDNPNPDTSWMEIIYEISQQLDLAGNCYISEIKAGAAGMPVQLWLLPSQYVSLKAGKEKLIDLYEYQEASSAKFKIDADDMIHLRLPNPNSRYFGQPVLMAAGRATDIDRESGIWQKTSLENRGVIDIHVEVPDTLQQDQIDAIKATIKEKQSGPKNAREPLVSSGKINNLGQNAVEMDFVESRKAVWAEICAVFGMSMSDLGFTENVNLANANAMQKQLYVNTIIPSLELVKRQLNSQLSREFGPEYCLEYDLSNVEALQENYTEKLTNGEKLWRMGFSLSQINKRLELGFDDADIPDEMLDNSSDNVDPNVDNNQVDSPTDIQKVALNGAQISSLKDVIMSVSMGELTAESAIALLLVAFPSIDKEIISQMVNSASSILIDQPDPNIDAPSANDAQVKRLLKAVGYGA